MFQREDNTYNEIREKSLMQWLDDLEGYEDVVVRTGVTLAREYFKTLKLQNEKLEEKCKLKDSFLKRMKLQLNEEKQRKTVKVVAAVICGSGDKEGKILATQRGYGEFQGGWEFPGGKIEKGEMPKEALIREIREELETEIEVGDLIDTIEYDYPTFHLSMNCFWCKIIDGKLVLNEHEAAKWLTKEQLDDVDWLPADEELIEKIIALQ